MHIAPHLACVEIVQIEAGDLFMFPEDGVNCFALRTEPFEGGKAETLMLGPEFPHQSIESYLLNWEPTAAITFGKNYSLILPTAAAAWKGDLDKRKAVCLALSGDEIFVCTNGGPSPGRYDRYYVNMATGTIQRHLPKRPALFTLEWEIVVPIDGNQTRSLLKYPTAA